MKRLLAALTCACVLGVLGGVASSALAQDSPTVVDRLAAFGFPFDEDGNPGVGRVRVGDTDLYVLGGSYAAVDRRNGQIVRSGALYFAVVDDNTVEMTFFGPNDRIEQTFVPAEVSDSGVFSSGQIVRSNGTSSPTSSQWYDFRHVHAEIIDGDVIPPVPDITNKECRCACSDGTSNQAGCTQAQCLAQLPCAPDPCALPQAEPGEPAQQGQMALTAAFGNCKYMDPCPPDCGSRELGLALLAAAAVAALTLRRALTT